MIPPSIITFTDQGTAKVRSLQSLAEFPEVLKTVDLPVGRPTLVVVGGASRLSQTDFQRVRSLFTEVFAPIAEQHQAVVVDGGTDAGVMRLMGQARAEVQGTFPLVGVAPIGLSLLPDQADQVVTTGDAAPLEPHHTHFFLVPGTQWGDESALLAQIASAIAGDAPSVTVLINGGEITWQDAAQSVEAGRSLLVIAGTGRTADVLATALDGEVDDPRAESLVQSGLVRSVTLCENHAELIQILQNILAIAA
jgi:SLOG in TRPM, prokaryote